ncbi:hypothetical protein ABZ922_36000 [Streptomyces shenzhenensis]|uniref:hypothetical protein n=1 Tax=Streptomyces shenzhenensis TaxID=943815 RepID=UPI0033E77F84
MTASSSTVVSVDLRVLPVHAVLSRIERALGVSLDPVTMVRKRRTVGARTDRDTWVRIERRPFAKAMGQGWNGTECAAFLDGVAKPAWFQGMSWADTAGAAVWRADETELLPGHPIGPDSALKLSADWWEALNASLDALAAQYTTRVATPDTVPITQARVTQAIRTVFPDVPDTMISEWSPAHADLGWANVTAPKFCLFDWEDWGMAPRGLDSAWIWGSSLSIPQLANRVCRERKHDLQSRDGMLMSLFFCATVALPHGNSNGPHAEFARSEAARIMTVLRST